jgi:hypothetical protein
LLKALEDVMHIADVMRGGSRTQMSYQSRQLLNIVERWLQTADLSQRGTELKIGGEIMANMQVDL